MDNWDNHWVNERKKLKNPIKRNNYFNYRLVKELQKHVNLSGFDSIELGCGTGRLSNFLSQYVNSVTLVDNSVPGLDIANELLGGKTAVLLGNHRFPTHQTKFDIMKKDLLKMKIHKQYDLVISSGLVEHFKGKEFHKLIKLHSDLTSKGKYCCFVFPSNNSHQRKSVKKKSSIEKYGWQNPKLEDFFISLLPKDLKVVVSKRIDYFSRVPYFFMALHRVLFHYLRIDLNSSWVEYKYGGYVFVLTKKA